MGSVRIGTSGWMYPHWRGRFYPPKLRAADHLAFYAAEFDTVELNNSFYRQPDRERFAAWARAVPDGFLFAVKGSRYVSHIKRMAAEQESIDRVVDSARGLGDRLGPILFQFQANFRADLRRLAGFLPRFAPEVRFVLEFRHDSWFIPEVFDLLRRYRVALCIADSPSLPQSLEVTADFTYIRFHHGPHGVGYSTRTLEAWAQRIAEWRERELDVYAYFNNDEDAWAIRNARTLRSLLSR
jgi:uncharacterized protein YecE (DUF72 family)